MMVNECPYIVGYKYNEYSYGSTGYVVCIYSKYSQALFTMLLVYSWVIYPEYVRNIGYRSYTIFVPGIRLILGYVS